MTTASTVVLVGHLGARSGRIRGAAEAAAAVFRANGFVTVLLTTESQEHDPEDPAGWGASLRNHLTATVASPPTAVVAVGGDGTAHVVINVLMQHRNNHGGSIAFGLIASGTGNDLARFWGSPTDDPERSAGRILRLLDTGATPMDVGQVDFDDGVTAWFVTALCSGFDATVNRRANGLRWPKGPLKYLVALVPELLVGDRVNSYQLEVTTAAAPGTVTSHRLEALMVNVANTSSIGGGHAIVPQASATDAVLELFLLAPLSRLRFLRVFPSIYTGSHVHLDAVEITPVTRIRIGGEHVVCADGEVLGHLPATVTVRPAALPAVL